LYGQVFNPGVAEPCRLPREVVVNHTVACHLYG